mgnify:CR=1 FL=1
MGGEHENFPEPVTGKAGAIVTADGVESVFLKRDRPCKTHMMFRTPYPDGGCHKGIAKAFSYFSSQASAMFGIHKKGEVRAVLFNSTTGHYYSGNA